MTNKEDTKEIEQFIWKENTDEWKAWNRTYLRLAYQDLVTRHNKQIEEAYKLGIEEVKGIVSKYIADRKDETTMKAILLKEISKLET